MIDRLYAAEAVEKARKEAEKKTREAEEKARKDAANAASGSSSNRGASSSGVGGRLTDEDYQHYQNLRTARADIENRIRIIDVSALTLEFE